MIEASRQPLGVAQESVEIGESHDDQGFHGLGEAVVRHLRWELLGLQVSKPNHQRDLGVDDRQIIVRLEVFRNVAVIGDLPRVCAFILGKQWTYKLFR